MAENGTTAGARVNDCEHEHRFPAHAHSQAPQVHKAVQIHNLSLQWGSCRLPTSPTGADS